MNSQQKLNSFLAQVDQTGDCWFWVGYCDKAGYGRIHKNWALEMGTDKAHRISYLLHKGDINGLDVLHQCDVRNCVNPEHLRLGTQTENNKDRDTRGRHARLSGSKNPFAKFTDEQIAYIRQQHDAGRTNVSIAEEMGVHRKTIGRIILGQHYAITPPW